jgi:SOS response regulatory protein OraA/RecX
LKKYDFINAFMKNTMPYRPYQKRKSTKKPRPITEERVWSYCLWYLSKYRVTRQKCIQKLTEKFIYQANYRCDDQSYNPDADANTETETDTITTTENIDKSDVQSWIMNAADKAEGFGYINDADFAWDYLLSCLQKHLSRKKIQEKFYQKNFSAAMIDHAFDHLETSDGTALLSSILQEECDAWDWAAYEYHALSHALKKHTDCFSHHGCHSEQDDQPDLEKSRAGAEVGGGAEAEDENNAYTQQQKLVAKFTRKGFFPQMIITALQQLSMDHKKG